MDFRHDDAGVTPVIGTIMVMAITVAGIGGILVWGAPAIQAIQDQGALAAMEGEFATLLGNTMVLRERDASRVPVIPLNDGSVELTQGTRIALHMANQDAPNANCAPRVVSGWHAESTGDLVIDAGAGCLPGPGNVNIRVFQLVGSTTQEQTPAPSDPAGDTITVPASLGDFSTGDWMITAEPNNGDPYLYVFLIDGMRFEWSLQTQSSDMRLMLEGGALYKEENGRVFQLAGAPIHEDVFGSGDYLLRLPTYVADDEGYGAPVLIQALVQLERNYDRYAQETTFLRYGFAGDLAEAWCNSMLLRNGDDTPGNYTADGGACTDGTSSVAYEPDAPFPFQFIHSRIHADMFL